MASEDVTLGEVYRVVTEIKAEMVTKETNNVVIESLRLADSGNKTAIEKVDGRVDGLIASIEQNARQIRTIWLTAIIGGLVAIATGVIVAKVTGLL